jgi:hypothetical protein
VVLPPFLSHFLILLLLYYCHHEVEKYNPYGKGIYCSFESLFHENEQRDRRPCGCYAKDGF